MPDEIVAVTEVPRTLTGKKLELPVKRILQGAAIGEIASREVPIDPFLPSRSCNCEPS